MTDEYDPGPATELEPHPGGSVRSDPLPLEVRTSYGYDLRDMGLRAADALAAHAGFVAEMEKRFRARQEVRQALNIPAVAILGYGRAGKDTAGAYLARELGLPLGGSSSDNLGVFVAHMVGKPYAEAYAERHSYRKFWIEAGHAVRGRDLTMLARMVLARGDFAVGLRGREELHGCQRSGLVQFSLWVDNPRVPRDETVEFGPDDCDLVVPNHGSFTQFYAKLDKLCVLLKTKYYL